MKRRSTCPLDSCCPVSSTTIKAMPRQPRSPGLAYARKKWLRRQRAAAAAAPVPLRALPWHEGLNRRPVEEYSTGWARPSSKCGSRLLDVEKDGWCCGQGCWRLGPLEPYPAAFANFLDQNVRALQNQSRTLNNLFTFSAIGYRGERLRFSGPQNVGDHRPRLSQDARLGRGLGLLQWNESNKVDRK
jgi:hypothetical protein